MLASDAACCFSISSCRTRSEMSRTISVYVVSRGDFSSDTDTSIGNDSPVARRADNERTLAAGSPDGRSVPSRPSAKARNWSMASGSSGKKRAIELPTASLLAQVNIRSAAELKSVMLSESSKRMIASSADVTTSRKRACDSHSSRMWRSSSSRRSLSRTTASFAATFLCRMYRSTNAATFDRRISG